MYFTKITIHILHASILTSMPVYNVTGLSIFPNKAKHLVDALKETLFHSRFYQIDHLSSQYKVVNLTAYLDKSCFDDWQYNNNSTTVAVLIYF